MERFIELFDEIYLNIDYIVLSALYLFIALSLHYFIYYFMSFFKLKKPSGGKTKYKFAIFIPARDESKVIKNCLETLKNQDYPKDKYDVYVIVEKEEDPTVNIVKEMGFNIIVRGDLEGRRTKGYALDDAYKYLRSQGIIHDAYMVFDADNIINPDYITLMNEVKNKGYKVGVGYRNYSNGTKNWLTRCSSILFSFINNFKSSGESRLFKKATLTGTGYYIDREIVEDAGGWVWNGMTEDVELTLYCHYHNIAMRYCDHAMYFDEQAPKLSVAHKQHIRWVWGYLNKNKHLKDMNDKDYHALNKFQRFISNYVQNVSLWPFVGFVIIEILALITSIAMLIASFFIQIYYRDFDVYFVVSGLRIVLYFSYLYLTFILLALFTFIADNGRLGFGIINVFKTSFSYMFFLAYFALGFLDGLFHKEKRTTWSQIEHGDPVLKRKSKK
ncbi:MAG: glycosyltransferase family 2 protein [Gammaproteobacteria bacterium]|nr:glycosyltransferase family 2 protein [Gammaproteobacteria bacterium]